ncbi:MAG: hypothetical protein WAK17_25670 [Candidatus Nitrosopolaris sp.]
MTRSTLILKPPLLSNDAAAEDTTYTHLFGRGHNVHTPFWKKNKVKQAKKTFF